MFNLHLFLLAFLVSILTTIVGGQGIASPCLVEGCGSCYTDWSCSVCLRNNSNITSPVPTCPDTTPCMVPNCLACVSGSQTSCNLCNDGFTLNAGQCSKQTIPIVENPLNCATAGQTPCKSCASGYYLNSSYGCLNGTQPSTNLSNCSIGCDSPGGQQCLVCNNSYLVSNANICVPQSSCIGAHGLYNYSIWCKSFPRITLRPEADLATFVDGLNDSISINIYIEFANPGPLDPSDFNFNWTIFGSNAGALQNLTSGIVSESAVLSIQGLTRTSVMVAGQAAVQFTKSFDSLVFAVGGYCLETNANCNMITAPLPDDRLTVQLTRKPTPKLVINTNLAVNNNPLDVSVSGLTALNSTPYLYFGFSFGVLNNNSQILSYGTLSGPNDVKNISLFLSTDKPFLLINLIMWDQDNLTAVVTRNVSVTNDTAIAAFQNKTNNGDSQNLTALKIAAESTLQSISDPATIATLPTDIKLSISSSIAQVFSSNVSYQEPPKQTATLSTTSSKLSISQIANSTLVEACLISCENGGVCTVDKGVSYCSCSSGYAGFWCQYPSNVSAQLQAVYASALTDVLTNTSATITDFTSSLSYVLQTPDLIAGNVTQAVLQAVNQYVNSSTPAIDLIPIAQALKWGVRSDTEDYLQSNSSSSTVVTSLQTSESTLKQIVQQIAISSVIQNGSGIQSLSGTNMRFGGMPISKSGSTSFSLSDSSSDFSVTIPSSVFNSASSSSSLIMIYISDDDNPYPYSNTTISNNIFSSTVSISFVDSVSNAYVPISGLSPPLTMSFPIPSGSQLQAAVNSFIALQNTTNNVNLTAIFANATACQYWDTTSNEWSGTGLALVSINLTHYTCNSTHTTDFVSVFFQSGLSVLEDSEFNLITQSDSWNALITTPLADNLGFWILLVVIISYLVLQSYGIFVDAMKFRFLPREQILDDIKDKKALMRRRAMEIQVLEEKKRKKREESAKLPSRLAGEPLNIEDLNSAKSLKPREIRIVPKNAIDHTVSNNSVNNSGLLIMELNSSMDRFVKPQNQAYGDGQMEANLNLSMDERSSGLAIQIKPKKKQEVIPRGFLDYWKEDLRDHHALFNCIFKTSRLSPRHARITLLYFTFLANFTFCIIFYKEPEYAMDSWEDFWLGLSEMFWSSLFSALCSCPVIFILSFLFKVPKGAIERLKKVSPEEFQFEMKRVARTMKCRYIIAYVLFFLAFVVCSLYILLFCAQVGQGESHTWLNSSAMSITIDQVGLEMVPGFLGGIFYIMTSRYRYCKLFGQVELMIAILRCYKTLSGY